MRTIRICLACIIFLSGCAGCAMTPRERAITAGIVVTSIALSARHHGDDSSLKTTQPVSCQPASVCQ